MQTMFSLHLKTSDLHHLYLARDLKRAHGEWYAIGNTNQCLFRQGGFYKYGCYN